MVAGWGCFVACVLFLCYPSSADLQTSTTNTQDEDSSLLMKRSVGYPQTSMLHYLLMAMSNPNTHYHSPQLLNRGVRRIGSEFLGKRSGDKFSVAPESSHECGGESCTSGKSDELKKEQMSFTGQYDYNDEIDTDSTFDSQENQDSSPTSKSKRTARYLYGDGTYDGLRNLFSMLSKKMGSEFLGKRMGSEFLGKRAMGSEFLGKRAMGSEFLGKRAMGSEFLGKRAMGSEFLGKRAMGSEFLGKRAMGSEFLGKRQQYPQYADLLDSDPKRAVGSEFLG